MATVKLRGKPWKKPRKLPEINGIHESCDNQRIEPNMNGSSHIEPTAYLSLNVLAQVAADTLQNSERLQSKFVAKKLSRRSIHCLDLLNLDQIQMLSDKTLLDFFSEMTCNEMARNYTYQCYLIPDKCTAKFTSFGNEDKAKFQIRQHLTDHIQQLIDEANDTHRQYRFIFTAEPVHVRHRRMSEMEKMKKRKSSSSSSCVNNSLSRNNQQKSRTPRKTYTSLKASKEIHSENKVPVESPNTVCKFEPKQASPRCTRSCNKRKMTVETTPPEPNQTNQNGPSTPRRAITRKQQNPRKRLKPKSSPSNSNTTNINTNTNTTNINTNTTNINCNTTNINCNTTNINCNTTNTNTRPKASVTPPLKSSNKIDTPTADEEEVACSNTSFLPLVNEEPLPKDAARRIKENEQLIIDLLNRTQPYLDHCYTTIFGKKRGIETFHERWEMEQNNSNNNNNNDANRATTITAAVTAVEDSANSDNKVAVVPILELGSCNEGECPHVALEEIVECPDVLMANEDCLGHCGLKPYPPMPKSALAKKGKIQVPEEEESFCESEKNIEESCGKKSKDNENAIDDLERKTALHCIRELKARKKDEKISLTCQICFKTFTASATLMYHYRSHAGIKPFVCLLCRTSFTRQHSLNYHMLIHNDQSRFTCKDCGRKFRHPSHFKEHLRRHTGETPFECKDCPQKFKTRNTYKRHLKTRHGKLLTATGIHVLSKEEFMKVRTKPYKKYQGLKETETVVEPTSHKLNES
ncbi:zinc finger protein 37 homolog [Argonauta hians]